MLWTVEVIKKYNPIITKIVVTIIPFLIGIIGSVKFLERTKGRLITVAISPNAQASKGNITKLGLSSKPAITTPTIMAAIFSAVIDSKRSAPRPATSPTLSPTLSAITAGLRGSSSGSPASTFPTKSAPTSAAFVNIPPPN